MMTFLVTNVLYVGQKHSTGFVTGFKGRGLKNVNVFLPGFLRYIPLMFDNELDKGFLRDLNPGKGVSDIVPAYLAAKEGVFNFFKILFTSSPSYPVGRIREAA